jgi:predicted DNA-binding transcriptional regulator YafY
LRRADRLFLIIHALRGRRSAMPARRLADTLEVSLRTVYRDVADLQRSGVPIEGEAGVGYVLRKGGEVPPLMFTVDELEALVMGTRLVGAFGGKQLALAARAALLKIEAVLPESLRQRGRRTRVYAPELPNRIEASDVLDRLRAAIDGHRVLRVSYRDQQASASEREVEPLCLSFWGDVWTLGAWCRLRAGFRSFRADRLADFAETGEVFGERPGGDLAGYLRTLGLEHDIAG